LDYWNIIVDRAIGTSVTISIDDVYLETAVGIDGSTLHTVHNKYTDKTWIVDQDEFSGLQEQFQPRGFSYSSK